MKPRKLLAGTYRIWRQTEGGRAILKPTPEVSQGFTYCLSKAATNEDVEVHGVAVALVQAGCVVSVDKDTLPKTLEEYHGNIAKVLQKLLGLKGSIWSGGSYGYERLETAAEVKNALAELYASPVKDGLVSTPQQWCGLSTYDQPFGEELEADRPEVYFDPDGEMPGRSSIELTLPPQLRDQPEEEVRLSVRGLTEARCAEYREALRKGDRKPLGVIESQRADPHRRPKLRRISRKRREKREKKEKVEREPYLSQERRVIRVARDFFSEWMRFVGFYKAALRDWCKGNREVLFPFGTYWMRVFHNARCDDH